MEKKKLVRLTESELHQIIAESVNKIISELDWKTYQSASNRAFDASMSAKSPEEKYLRQNQSAKFNDMARKKLSNTYDGVNMGNYDDRNLYPDYKRVDDNGKTVNFMKNNFGNEDDVKPTDRDKQIRGAANIARFNRGGYKYVPGTTNAENGKLEGGKWKKID